MTKVSSLLSSFYPPGKTVADNDTTRLEKDTTERAALKKRTEEKAAARKVEQEARERREREIKARREQEEKRIGEFHSQREGSRTGERTSRAGSCSRERTAPVRERSCTPPRTLACRK